MGPTKLHIVFFTRALRETTHNNGGGPLTPPPKKKLWTSLICVLLADCTRDPYI